VTDDDWAVIAERLDANWKARQGEEFDGAREANYRFELERAGHDAEAVNLALDRLLRSQPIYLPTVGEIIQAVEEPLRPTAWTSAYAAIRRAIAIAGPDEERALAELEGPRGYVHAFVRTIGYDHLRTLPLDDPQWGGAEQRRLEQRYADFCESARERARDGRALAAVGRRSLAGLQQPNFAAALPSGEETA
jgi:hypothetical protein